MKIIEISKLEKTDKDVSFTGGHSIRALIESDNMGFGVCKTYIPKGGPHHWHYQNHLEACYCIYGTGIITDLSSGKKHSIKPDIMYVLDKNDDHTFEALEDTILISIFNPPLKGTEYHDKNGNYSI